MRRELAKVKTERDILKTALHGSRDASYCSVQTILAVSTSLFRRPAVAPASHIHTLDDFHEALCHAATLRAMHWCCHRFQSQGASKRPCFCGGIAVAIVDSHSISVGAVVLDPNRYSTACIIKSPTGPASMPFVVATQLITSRSAVQGKGNPNTLSVVAATSKPS